MVMTDQELAISKALEAFEILKQTHKFDYKDPDNIQFALAKRTRMPLFLSRIFRHYDLKARLKEFVEAIVEFYAKAGYKPARCRKCNARLPYLLRCTIARRGWVNYDKLLICPFCGWEKQIGKTLQLPWTSANPAVEPPKWTEELNPPSHLFVRKR